MFLNSTILLIYLCWSQSISKMSSPYGPKAASLYSCPCVPISSNLSKSRAISIEQATLYQILEWRRVHPRTKNRSSAAGVDLWWSANHRMKWFRATRRSGFLFSPEGEKTEMRGGPSLKVKGGLVGFRRSLKVKGGQVGFRKKQRASSPLANPWVKAGSSPHKKPQLRCWRRPLMVRQPYSVAVWAPSRAVGTSLVPWGEKGLGKAVEPSLMVKKDGLILEKT